MKTDRASIFAALALTLSLCACGPSAKDIDAKGEATPAPKVKKAKEEAPNAQPPESTEPAKNMNAGAPEAAQGGGAPGGGAGLEGDEALKYLNGLVKMYSQRAGTGQTAMQSGMKMNDPKAAQKQYQANKAKAAAKALTSLDQLVAEGVVKSLPEAPAGKKFVLDTKTQVVSLQNK